MSYHADETMIASGKQIYLMVCDACLCTMLCSPGVSSTV